MASSVVPGLAKGLQLILLLTMLAPGLGWGPLPFTTFAWTYYSTLGGMPVGTTGDCTNMYADVGGRANLELGSVNGQLFAAMKEWYPHISRSLDTTAKFCAAALDVTEELQQACILPRDELDAAQPPQKPFRIMYLFGYNINVLEHYGHTGSERIRGFVTGAQLATLGHDVIFADYNSVAQVNLSSLDAVVIPKYNSRGMIKGLVHDKAPGLPIIFDHIDDELLINRSSHSLRIRELWDLEPLFAGTFTSNRMMKLAIEKHSKVPAVVTYHQHTNLLGFHRSDRSTPVRTVGFMGTTVNQYNISRHVLDVLSAHGLKHNFTVRHGFSVGKGYKVEELAAAFKAHDWSNQAGYYMGYDDVDIGIIWPLAVQPFFVCQKPVTRALIWMSLGIPVIMFSNLSYLELAYLHGYPLIARNTAELLHLLDLLRGDAGLRQAVSELGLQIAAKYSNVGIMPTYTKALAQIIAHHAAKRRHMQ